MQFPPPFLADAEPWLERAESDLGVAIFTMANSSEYRDAVAFHAQQAAEKALKGFLVAHGQPIERTHSLIRLIEDCETVDPLMQQFAFTAQTLTPYATEFRYPGRRSDPPDAEAQSAVQLASAVVSYVRARLSSPPLDSAS